MSFNKVKLCLITTIMLLETCISKKNKNIIETKEELKELYLTIVVKRIQEIC